MRGASWFLCGSCNGSKARYDSIIVYSILINIYISFALTFVFVVVQLLQIDWIRSESITTEIYALLWVYMLYDLINLHCAVNFDLVTIYAIKM